MEPQDEPPPLQRTNAGVEVPPTFAPSELTLPKLLQAIRDLDFQKVTNMITQKPKMLDKASAKSSVNPQNVYNISPLLTAVMTGNVDMVRLIASNTSIHNFLPRLNSHATKQYNP